MTRRTGSRLILVAILLLAAGLRFARLGAQSFWNDEGNSARIAERTVDLILEGAGGDIHPPGYYLLLHYWRALLGHSEFALRAFSAAAGIVLVAATYLLGKRLFDDQTGLIAAFLGALSPLAVYYSQEARMYALLAALSALSTYLLLRMLDARRSPAWPAAVPYVLATTAGLYTQYAFPFILLVHNGVFGLWWWTAARSRADRCRWIGLWTGTQIATVALYLPWLPIALRSVTGWTSAGQTESLGQALLNVLHVLGLGLTLPFDGLTLPLAGIGVLLVAGLWPHRTERLRGLGVLAAGLYLLLPIALILAFGLYKPAWLKFLVVVLPPLHVLLARGMGNLARLVQQVLRGSRIAHGVVLALLLLAAVLVTRPALRNLYLAPEYQRADYRGIAADVAAAARPGDAIILNAPNQWEVFTYYYPDRDVYPIPYQPQPDEAEAFLSPLVAQYNRLFVIYWGDAEADPQRLVESWLAAHAYPATDSWYGDVRLVTYGAAGLPAEPAATVDARLGEKIRLRGYALPETAAVPGDVLPVSLFWEAEGAVPEPYKVTVQLFDAAGGMVAQHDAEPGSGFAPTTGWQPSEAIIDRHGVPVPDPLPPGTYTLQLALYHAWEGDRLPVTLDGQSAGDHLVLGSVEIVVP